MILLACRAGKQFLAPQRGDYAGPEALLPSEKVEPGINFGIHQHSFRNFARQPIAHSVQTYLVDLNLFVPGPAPWSGALQTLSKDEAHDLGSLILPKVDP